LGISPITLHLLIQGEGKVKQYRQWLRSTLVLSVLLSGAALAAEKTIDVHLLNDDSSTRGIGKKIGTITFQDSKNGLMIRPHLAELSPGEHGFHIHEMPSCEAQQKDNKWAPGMAAGGHLDPQHTGKHLGPNGKGHLGDLPVLVVDKEGKSQFAVVDSRLTLADVQGHSIMIHQGGDNYSDTPPMGGGGARIACGVIK
jgi:superoxide dismutase, Cu-Zn family